MNRALVSAAAVALLLAGCAPRASAPPTAIRSAGSATAVRRISIPALQFVPVDAFSEPKAVVVGDPIPVGAYTPLFDGSHIISAQWVTGGNATATETVLSLKLDSTATTEFARWTKAHIGSRLAAVFSGRVLVAPTVEMSVDTGNVILGGKTVLAARAALDKAQVVAP